MLITRCPNCTTAFRVSPEQLKAMHGKVRCGQCQLVFNAIDTLLDMSKEPAAPAETLPDLFELEEALPAPALTPDTEIREQLAPPTILPDELMDDEDGPSGQIEPLLHQETQTAPRRLAWLWALAAALALLLLILQAALHFRVELSVLTPDVKPVLQDLCNALGCDIPLPRKVDLLSIESSDLHPDSNGQLVLVATLKNRAPFSQTYPHLELTLTGITEQPLLRKVLAPADYLTSKVDAAAGFAMHGEIAVNLALTHENTDSTEATGYRLYLFYP